MRAYRGVNPTKTRDALQEVDLFLRDVARELSLNQASPDNDQTSSFKNAEYVVLSLSSALNKERKLVANSPLLLTDHGANANVELDLSVASLFGAPAITYAASSSAGAALTAIATDSVLQFPQALRSVAATAGDTLTLTSDGTNLTLTPSRADSEVLIKDQAGVQIIKVLNSTTSAAQGLAINGGFTAGLNVGMGGPTTSAVFQLEQKLSQKPFVDFFWMQPFLDGEVGATSTIIVPLSVAIDGMTTDNGSGNLTGYRVEFIGDASAVGPQASVMTPIKLINLTANMTLDAASTPTTELIGLDIGSALNMTPAPTRTYAIKVVTAGNGTTAWAGSFSGRVQIHGTSELGFGKTQASGTAATNTLRSKTATGTIIVTKLNNVDTYEWDTTSIYPVTNGGAALGKNGNGWSSILFKDTAAAFEITEQFTCTGISADRTLTWDLGNASRTLTLSGNPTLADWFDQSVKAAASPSFAGLTVNTFAFTVTGAPTLDNWFDQSVKSTASPTHASLTLTADLSVQGNTTIGNATTDTVRFNSGGNAAAPATNAIGIIVDYFGTSATRVLTTPNRWWSIIADDGNTYKVALYA